MSQGNPPVVPTQARQTCGLAIASLVLGIVSLPLTCGCCGTGIVAAILAIVFGHIARGQIRRSEGRLNGKGMAVAGLVIGYASVAIQILVTILLVIWTIFAACMRHPEHFHWHHW
jgi:hypothetical protein